MKQSTYYLSAKQAADALGVTTATLYAYTSRGQLQSETVPGKPRERRYYREDVERLRERKEARRNPAVAAARGLHWGSPVLESGITLIQDGKLYYRGRDAVKLADSASLEELADLLWEAEPGEWRQLFAQPCALSPALMACLRTCTKNPFTLFQTALPLAGIMDPAAHDLRPSAVRQTGARLLRLLTAIAAAHDSQSPMHLALQARWARRNVAAGRAIRAALVLCADHELNVSAFTARCAASAAASPYDVVSAALATLKGYKHGGATERISRLFAEAETPRHARGVIASRLRRGESIPGFGHPLYPAGDPRATPLMRLAQASGNETEWRLIRSLREAGWKLLNDLPNLDFALVAVARAYGLPEFAPLLLFALGRAVGWIAHAIEQYAAGDLIRPRARYTGPAPEAGAT
ncbi:MAG: citrate synthase family protein [Acidobacteriaceae bacterium]|nr:citrate synthase family protein [Acidobacteriaceae bacterium]